MQREAGEIATVAGDGQGQGGGQQVLDRVEATERWLVIGWGAYTPEGSRAVLARRQIKRALVDYGEVVDATTSKSESARLFL